MSFEGKVVIVTGASSGIGAQTAKDFAKGSAKVVLVGRNAENLKSIAEECGSADNVLSIQADMNNEDDVKKIIDETIKKFNQIDVLVNSAGIIEIGSIENTSMEQYDRVMNTNMRSIYQISMLAVPHLIKTQGNIVNVSSVNGIRSFAGVLSYNISKAAVDQFTRCVALELAPKNVRVNSVNPGVIITNIHKRGGMNDEAYAAFLERSKTTHPLGRPGTVNEVSEVITFLASDKATFITGASIPIDGGRHATCLR
ncbi:3-oxoacyl-[acyl-carrier-protein] reductase FabG-like [Chironomus tepperi]|uniref:3-oxoacyl-[acyl-carrier-protein] reductase FabG-like n=1 Tax=Chironomus tepperi TaxID=113505 RepID=UPI00391F3BDC